VGIWTIGYGHTSAAGPPEVTKGLVITQEEANDLFRHDIGQYEKAVSDRIGDAPTKSHQFDAMVSLCYNIGTSGYRNSTVAREHVNKRYLVAADAFLKWNKPPEIMGRRKSEQKQYEGDK
jgi:lysozyme